MYDKSQLMRGTLEGCILKILSKSTSYGYEIGVNHFFRGIDVTTL